MVRKADRKFYYCGKSNHLIKDCFQKKKDECNGINKPVVVSTVVIDSFYKGLAAVMELYNLNFDIELNDWVIDSDCTHFMSPNKMWFANLRKYRE